VECVWRRSRAAFDGIRCIDAVNRGERSIKPLSA
jgi:hypothetical protein